MHAFRLLGISWRVVLCLSVCLVMPCFIAGCFDAEKERARLDQTAAALAEERTSLDIKRMEVIAAKADTAKVDAEIARVDKLSADLERVRAVVNKSINPDGTLNGSAIGAAAGAALPPPWNLVALIGAPLLTGAIQQFRLNSVKADADQIVDSVEAMRAASPALKTEMGAQKNAAARVLTRAGAKRIIQDRSIT